jgi:hypothetical protein
MSESQIDQITTYLSAAIPGSRVSTRNESATGETVISIRHGECEYTLRVDEDFIAAYQVQEVPGLLSTWNVAAELTRSEGIPLMLTAAGIRLASSN